MYKLYCSYCNSEFTSSKRYVQYVNRKKSRTYCTPRCKQLSHGKTVFTKCGSCNKPIDVPVSVFNKSKCGKVFCSQNCSSAYVLVG